MSSISFVIFGAGGHAKVVADLVRACGHDVTGFIDTTQSARKGESFAGSVILGGMEEARAHGATHAALGFGDNASRLALAGQLLQSGWQMPVLIHPSAVVSPSAEISDGTVIFATAVVQAAARIGKACIVNTAAIVEHDCDLADGVHLAPRSCLCGTVRIGRATFVGAGTVVREKITIGSGAKLGAGSVVVKNVADGSMAYGVPARVVES